MIRHILKFIMKKNKFHLFNKRLVSGKSFTLYSNQFQNFLLNKEICLFEKKCGIEIEIVCI